MPTLLSFPSVCFWLARTFLPPVLFLSALPTSAQTNPATALEDYVNTPDSAFGYDSIQSLDVPLLGVEIHLLSMTSQSWRSPEEVDLTLWTHLVALIVPDDVRTSTGAVLVLGGNNRNVEIDIPSILGSEEVQVAAALAKFTGSIVSLVANIPNQPLVFWDAPLVEGGEPLALAEDALVAYTWDKAMDTGDWNWPAYLPMVKAVVRTMDTAHDYASTELGIALERFVVIGFSKRGATAWLTAAVDDRVVAVAPGVIDVLNMAPQLEHHYSAYGFYSSALDDYIDYGIVRRVRSPEGQELLAVVDPYNYRAALNLPKFLLNSPGDQFFLPDSQRFYASELAGETLTRYVPNTDHSLSIEALTSLLAWYQQVLADGGLRPEIEATVDGDVLTVTSVPPADAASLWTAVNPTERDFRQQTIGDSWTSSYLDDRGGNYAATLSPPATGYGAYFVELEFVNRWGVPQTYTTRVYVVPDTLPFEVVDPVADPRGKGYWQARLNAAISGRGPVPIDSGALADYFPLPLFDAYVTDVASAGAVFDARGGTLEEARAQCLATRLNIASEALGWYSPLALDERGVLPLWEHYQTAHAAFLDGQPERAKSLCEAINGVDASGLGLIAP